MASAKLKSYYAEKAKARMIAGKGHSKDPMENLQQGAARDQAAAKVDVSGKALIWQLQRLN